MTERVVKDWEWRNSDTGGVEIYGYDEDEEVVVKRWFALDGTRIKTDDGGWEDVEDDGGWSPEKTIRQDQ